MYDDENRSELQFIYEVQKKDDRIKVLVNNENLGAGFSRNKGIQFSKGKYIAFLDADDFWEEDKLEKQISSMSKNNYLITHTSYNILGKNNKFKSTRLSRDLNFKNLLKSCDVGLSTVIIDKTLFEQNKFSNLKTKEDYTLWLSLTRSGHKFYAIQDVLSSWRISKNSLSSSVPRKLIDGFNVYYKYMNFSLIKSIFYLLQLSIYFLWKKLKS